MFIYLSININVGPLDKVQVLHFGSTEFASPGIMSCVSRPHVGEHQAASSTAQCFFFLTFLMMRGDKLMCGLCSVVSGSAAT